MGKYRFEVTPVWPEDKDYGYSKRTGMTTPHNNNLGAADDVNECFRMGALSVQINVIPNEEI